MNVLEVKKTTDFPKAVFDVKVKAETETSHTVTLEQDYFMKLTGGKTIPEVLIHKVFNYLLENEPNTSILPNFNVSDVPKYFPEFESKMK